MYRYTYIYVWYIYVWYIAPSTITYLNLSGTLETSLCSSKSSVYLKYSKVNENINYLNTKILLRKILLKYLPEKLINKKK